MPIASMTRAYQLTCLKPQMNTEASRGEGELNNIMDQLQSWKRSPMGNFITAYKCLQKLCQIVGDLWLCGCHQAGRS